MVRTGLRSALWRGTNSRGGAVAAQLFRRAFKRALSKRTLRLISFDIARLRARTSYPKEPYNNTSRLLHLGCGTRKVDGWCNADVSGSDFDVDLAHTPLPFKNESFDAVVSQHVIEHLDFDTELGSLFSELGRIVAPGGEIWLSCPDMAKICASYVADRGQELVDDKRFREHYDPTEGGRPPQVVVNWLFHQGGEHKNLLDLELVRWLAKEADLGSCEETTEEEFLDRFPAFPARNDGRHSLYVRIRVD